MSNEDRQELQKALSVINRIVNKNSGSASVSVSAVEDRLEAIEKRLEKLEENVNDLDFDRTLEKLTGKEETKKGWFW